MVSEILELTPVSMVMGAGLGSTISELAGASSTPDPTHMSEQTAARGRLLSTLKPEWYIYPFAFLSTLFYGAFGPIQGLLISHAFRSFYVQPLHYMLEQINEWSLLLILLGIIAFFGDFAKHCIFTYIQECLTLRLREQAFSAILRQEMGFFDEPSNGSSSLMSALARQTGDISLLVGLGLGQLIQALFGIALGILLGFCGSWKLTLVIMATTPFVIISIVIATTLLDTSPDQTGHARADELATMALLNIRTVRSYLAESWLLQLFSEQVSAVAVKELNGAPKKGIASGWGNAVPLLLFIIGFAYGGHLIGSEGVDPSAVYQSMLCFILGFMSLPFAATFGPIAVKGWQAAHEVFVLIDRESKIDAVCPLGEHQNLGDGSIRFENVNFYYPHRQEMCVLQGLNFTVSAGQTVAFVGPSGSGKSTVIQLLLRFYDPSSGAIKVGGVELQCFNIAWWRRRVGLVGQEPVLFDMSLEENVKYGYPEATRAEVETAAHEANMDYAFSGMIGWEDKVGIRGERLSGGQKQRCAIARAILRQPAVLLLDEATSALDSVSEHMVQQALDNARRGRTTFTIAHRLSSIVDSDLIFFISAGTVSESGTHEELMASHGLYAHLSKQGHV